MKITFENFNQNPAVDKVTTSQEVSSAFKGQFAAGAFALDISGMVMDNNAYGDHGRSIKDVMQSFDAQVDFDVQRDYMTVMSNIMSTEDFNKMMEDGFDPSKLEPEQVVTIIDHIKAEMAKSGQVIEGYNDDLSEQKLKEIVGDPALAKEIEKSLKGAKLPVSEKNVTALKESLDKAGSVGIFDDASKKYMVDNQLTPTVENIYRASFSALGDGSKQGRGYYAQEMKGYFAKKADSIDWNAMQPQLEKAVKGMHLEDQTMEQSMHQAKWLMEKGIPVTESNMNTLSEVEKISVPLDKNTVIKAGVNALIEGKSASEGKLIGTEENIYEKAVRYTEEVNTITEDAIKKTLYRGDEVNLRNLYSAQMSFNAAASTVSQSSEKIMATQSGMQTGFIHEKFVTASRQLAEVQLRMTIDANIKLLKSNYAIDTAPLSELVDVLKEQEFRLSRQFFSNDDPEIALAKANLFTRTQNTVKDIPSLPAALIGKITYAQSPTLSTVHSEGEFLRAKYEAAGALYERFMTSPRADLGDSIEMAFRNVDDILKDMNLELTEDNRKAVRILGYNSMEITPKAVADVKDASLQLENIVKGMTPQRTLSMIREGVNPLTMDLSDLEQYLNSLDSMPEEEMTKYSRYLYELEKNGEITLKERDSYIGIYRMLHQIEKSDRAAIGSLVEQGAELTFGNLLTAVRSRRPGMINYKIDDSFTGAKRTIEKGKSISEQIENGIREARLAKSIFSDVSVESLKQAGFHNDMTLEKLRENMNQSVTEEISQESAKEFLRQQKAAWNLAHGTNEAVLQTMKEYGIAFTVENIIAAGAVFSEKGQLSKSAKAAAARLDEHNEDDNAMSQIKDAEAEIIDSLTDFDSAQRAMEKWEKCMSDTFTEATSELKYSSKEVKEMFMTYKQISVISTMRKAESYEVPMEIDGEMTSVNLTLLHDEAEKGTVAITMSTESMGKAGVKFRIVNNRIESYFIADSEMGKEKLQMAGERILEQLRRSGMEIGATRYVNAYSQGRKEWNLLTFSSREADNNSETVATKRLYHIAKTVLKGIRDFI